MDSRMVSRRKVIHAAMRTGVYVAPAVLSVGMATRTAAVSAPTQTPLPLAPTRPPAPTATTVAVGVATITSTPAPTVTPAPTATTVPVGAATFTVVQAGMTADAPLNITGSGFLPGVTLNIVFSSPSGTTLDSVQALTSATGTFRVLFNPSNLPIGTLTVKATQILPPISPTPALASTTFTQTANMPQNVFIGFTSGSQILAGNSATVEADELVAGNNYTFSVITADGKTALTSTATAVAIFPGATQGSATISFSTAGFPLGTVYVAVGPTGSSNLLAFTTGQVV